MIIAEAPTPIDGLASAASVILIIEVGLIIVLVAALAVAVALLMRWMYNHTIPPVQHAIPRVKSAIDATDRATGRVIDLVTAVYSRRRGFEVAIQTFLDGVLPPEGATDDAVPLDGYRNAEADD